ncbi:hypothetical protein Leryth_022527, partial [Lithospermum erythrorhizon]
MKNMRLPITKPMRFHMITRNFTDCQIKTIKILYHLLLGRPCCEIHDFHSFLTKGNHITHHSPCMKHWKMIVVVFQMVLV